jgi:uncharacterized membrane protein YhaH (DUF805 family)
MLSSIILTVTFLSVLLALWFFEAGGRGGTIILLMFFVPYLICGYLLSAQRLRDMNQTGWLALLWVPVGIIDSYVGGAASFAFFIVLCVVPGTQGENRYGPDPLQSGC